MSNLIRNLVIIAKKLANTSNVDVDTWQQETAAIQKLGNGRLVIHIPSAWSWTSDPQAAELLEGIIDHEALGHGRFTDFSAHDRWSKDGKISWNKLTSAIQNILEDVYIENQAMQVYPGVKSNLCRTVEILQQREFFGNRGTYKDDDPTAGVLVTGLLNVLRSNFISGQDAYLADNAAFFDEVLTRRIGNVWIEVLAIASEVEHSKSTDDNVNLTIRIMDLLKDISKSKAQEGDSEESEDQPGEDESGEGEGGGDGSDNASDSKNQKSKCGGGQAKDDGESEDGEGEGSGDTSDSENQDSQAGSGQSGNEDGADSSDKSSNSKSGSKSKGGKSGKSGSYSQEEIESAKAILKDKNSNEISETEISVGASTAIDKAVKADNKDHGTSAVLKDSFELEDLTQNAMLVAKQLKNSADELMDALVSVTRSEKSNKMTGKRLNNRILSRVKTGNANIFSSKIDGESISTAVSVLIDDSGSMTAKLEDGVFRSDAAKGLMVGMADILDEFECPFEMAIYSDSFAEYKNFEQDWGQIKRSKKVPCIGSGTTTGRAVERVLSSLVVRPEERKLLIVVTDGNTDDLGTLMSCYSEAQLMGIEIASIMVGPMIPSITALASRFNFKAVSTNQSAGIGRFAVQRVLEMI